MPEIRPPTWSPPAAASAPRRSTAPGRLVDDFRFATGERTVHVLNAPSPAATAALAIGEEIAATAVAALGLG